MSRKLIFAAVVIIQTMALVGAGNWSVALATGTSPDAIQGACNEKGGTYSGPSGPGATYGCLYNDGTVTVCGGNKQGCDTYPPAKDVTIVGLPGGSLPWEVDGVLLAFQNQKQLDDIATQIQKLQDSIDTLSNQLNQIIQ